MTLFTWGMFAQDTVAEKIWVLYQSEWAKGFDFHEREIGRSEGKVE